MFPRFTKITKNSLSANCQHLVKFQSQLGIYSSPLTEYFLINILLLFNTQLLSELLYDLPQIGFMVGQLTDVVAFYTNSVWPDYRKKQTYLSSLLSRNEVDSRYPNNRKLFVRTQRGYY
jgi:hypothetical protein